MNRKITLKRILQQLKADLIGKDSYRGVTLTYAWLANQFGHIALGFIPAFLLFYFFKIEIVNCAVYVSVTWLLFEIYNFLGPLLSNKESGSELVFIPKKASYIFKPKWGNVTFDTFTDVCFFAFGAFLFSMSITKGRNYLVNLVLIVLGCYLLYASRYWFITKMYQSFARFPFQFRLSQWDFHINKTNKIKVDTFLESNNNAGNHLLIYGAFGSGKTSLGVGVLNELSIKNNRCLYKTGIKMFNAFFNDENDIANHEIWNWRMAEFLMIDDINPGNPIDEELVIPSKLLSFIDTLQPIHKENRSILTNKNVIWVLGSKPILNESKMDQWKELLLEIGISEDKISTINLSE